MDLSKNLYEPANSLADYLNVFAGIRLLTDPGVPLDGATLKKGLKEHPLPLVEERYARQSRNNGNWRDIIAHPAKVMRINLIAQLVNSNSTNVTLFKRAANTVTQLLCGLTAALPYDEPDYNPDLLELPALSWIDYYILAVNNLHLWYLTEDDPEIPSSRKRITHGFAFMAGVDTEPTDISHLTPAQHHARLKGNGGVPDTEAGYGFSRKYWNQTYEQFFMDLDDALRECGFTAADTVRVSEPRGLETEAWYQERWKVFYPIFVAMVAKGYKRPELLK